LETKTICKTGKNIHSCDAKYLSEDWNVALKNWEDSAHSAKIKGLTPDKRLGLGHILRVLLNTRSCIHNFSPIHYYSIEIIPHNLYRINRLPGKQDTQLRCSAWNKKLSNKQIQYAAMDAVAGSLIDYIYMQHHLLRVTHICVGQLWESMWDMYVDSTSLMSRPSSASGGLWSTLPRQ
jgi:hypothetical protein